MLKATRECPITEMDKSYLAGTIDCDGSICFWLGKSKKHPNWKHWIIPKINLTNKNLELLNWAQNTFGFCISVKPKIKKQRRVYCLEVNGRNRCLSILRLILPYLKAKKQQAELIIEFCENHKYKKYTPRDWEIFKLVKELNRRGEKR